APFPVVDAACERDDVLVAQLLQGSCGKGRPVPGSAVGDDLPSTVGNRLLDPRFEPAARKMDGRRDVALVPFLALSDIQEDRRLGVVVQLARASGVDLVDLLSGLLEEIAVRAHCFPIYSDL